MGATGVRAGDRVRVETKSFEGVVKSYDGGGSGRIGGRSAVMRVLTDDGHNHYFDPTLADVTVTVIPPAFRLGQVWQTPDGTQWFIRRAAKLDFSAVPVGSDGTCNIYTTFLQKLPKLIFPVAS